MGDFNAQLFKWHAEGKKARDANGKKVWTKDQLKKIKKSKNALYKIVLLRAAKAMEVQAALQEEKRVAAASFEVTVTNRSIDRQHNKARAQHTFNLTMTDPRLLGIVVASGALDDEETKMAIKEFIDVGFSCPGWDP